MSQMNMSAALDTVARVTGMTLPFPVELAGGKGLHIYWQGGAARIAAEDENALCRGVFLLTQAVRAGRKALRVDQERHFASCGAMIDMSRNGVFRVEAVKRFIDRMACLGMNVLMLYTEDTYEVP